jgi:acetyl esterase/lipase
MSWRSLLVNRAIRLTGAKRRSSSAEMTRQHIERLTVRPARYAPSRALVRGLSVSVQRVGGTPVYTAAPEGHAPGHHLLYLHGGAYTYEIRTLDAARISEKIRGSLTTTLTGNLPGHLSGTLPGA